MYMQTFLIFVQSTVSQQHVGQSTAVHFVEEELSNWLLEKVATRLKEIVRFQTQCSVTRFCNRVTILPNSHQGVTYLGSAETCRRRQA